MAVRPDLGFKIRARVRNAVVDDAHAARKQFFRIGKIITREDEAQIHGPEQPVGGGAKGDDRLGFKPLGEAGGVPVQNHILKKWPAEQHHQPVAIEGDAFAGGGNVIKVFDAVAKPKPDGLQAKPEDKQDFYALKFADIRQPARETGIDVVTFEAERMRRARFFFARVAAQAREHELHHVALAVVRRRRVGENQ